MATLKIKDADGNDVFLNVDVLPDGSLAQSMLAVNPDTGEQVPAASEDSLRSIAYLLKMINKKLGPLDAAFRIKVLVDAANNAAMNVSLVGGTGVSVGLGASGNGTLRVTPATDTLAGITHVYQYMQMVGNLRFDAAFRSKVTL